LNVICSAADLDQPAFEACNKYWREDGKWLIILDNL
jgi:hypothetical protein